MKILTVISLLTLSIAHAEPFPNVFFEDDFSGTELKEEWGSWKSETVVKDGVMVGITPRTADHPSVNTIQMPPRGDLEVVVSFKFAGSNRFSVMFRDLEHKGSHAGHICHVAVGPGSVTLYDGKTGMFRKDLRDKRKAGEQIDKETQEMLKTKQSRNEVAIDPKAWNQLRIRIEGDVMKVWIGETLAGTLQSEGIAHPTKSNMNITTFDREVHYDDFSIRVP